MRNFILIAAVLALVLPAGCSKSSGEAGCATQEVKVQTESLQSGRMRIFVSEEMAAAIESDPDAFARENPQLQITGLERTFPEAGEFEERTRRAGLHRWYDVSFSSGMPLTKAGESLVAAQGVITADYVPRLRRPQYIAAAAKASAAEAASAADGLPFNDPYLGEQWNYLNTTSGAESRSGCDVNVVPVWKSLKSGAQDVIVAVVDGGIDFTHEDLSGNMWHNPDHASGASCGYNFIYDSYGITAEEHGTHIAGTIAAVNNNGTGVCGIAGGDAAAGIPGVRLMSCQIFEADSEDSGDDIRAIKWAADHGAVICQCSWDYDGAWYMPESTRRAIDYFIEYAGCDALGNQTGPMKGGLVVFAAGNDGSAAEIYPAAYDKVLAVSALKADYRLASYSDYGSWVDIAAPGGAGNMEILSTVPGNGYASFSGTSMATPHVSAVAALIVANLGGEGFTAAMLRDILLSHTTDISGYNTVRYPGKGLVNAYDAIASNPGSVQFSAGSKCAVQGRRIAFTADLSPASEGVDPLVASARIYYAKDPFSSTEGIEYVNCSIMERCSASPFTISTGPLDYCATYYAAVQFFDEYGNATPLSAVTQVQIVEDMPPTIEPLQPLSDVIVRYHDTAELDFTVSDPAGDDVSVSIAGDDRTALFCRQTGSYVQVFISGRISIAGSHTLTLTATDATGLSCSVEVPYTALENSAPVVLKPLQDTIIDKNVPCLLNLGEIFYDADGESLFYDINSSDDSLLKISVANSVATLTAVQYGSADITITAYDAKAEEATASFRLLSRDTGSELEIYPNPASGPTLYLRSAAPVQVSVTLRSAAGGEVLSGSFSAGPFDPAAVDISALNAGTYTLTAEYAGKTITRMIVKL